MQCAENLLVIRKLDAYSVPALKQHTKIQDNLIPPTPERIVRLFVRQALLFLSLTAVIAFPCFSKRQTSSVKSASLRASACLGSRLSVRLNLTR